jgi:hypothetical protein
MRKGKAEVQAQSRNRTAKARAIAGSAAAAQRTPAAALLAAAVGRATPFAPPAAGLARPGPRMCGQSTRTCRKGAREAGRKREWRRCKAAAPGLVAGGRGAGTAASRPGASSSCLKTARATGHACLVAAPRPQPPPADTGAACAPPRHQRGRPSCPASRTPGPPAPPHPDGGGRRHAVLLVDAEQLAVKRATRALAADDCHGLRGCGCGRQ